jgi:hypothetical protein
VQARNQEEDGGQRRRSWCRRWPGRRRRPAAALAASSGGVEQEQAGSCGSIEDVCEEMEHGGGARQARTRRRSWRRGNILMAHARLRGGDSVRPEAVAGDDRQRGCLLLAACYSIRQSPLLTHHRRRVDLGRIGNDRCCDTAGCLIRAQGGTILVSKTREQPINAPRPTMTRRQSTLCADTILYMARRE